MWPVGQPHFFSYLFFFYFLVLFFGKNNINLNLFSSEKPIILDRALQRNRFLFGLALALPCGSKGA